MPRISCPSRICSTGVMTATPDTPARSQGAGQRLTRRSPAPVDHEGLKSGDERRSPSIAARAYAFLPEGGACPEGNGPARNPGPDRSRGARPPARAGYLPAPGRLRPEAGGPRDRAGPGQVRPRRVAGPPRDSPGPRAPGRVGARSPRRAGARLPDPRGVGSSPLESGPESGGRRDPEGQGALTSPTREKWEGWAEALPLPSGRRWHRES